MMAPTCGTVFIIGLMAGCVTCEFRAELEPDVAHQGQEVKVRCHVLGEDPRIGFEWFRIDASGNHEIIAVNRKMTPGYLTTRTDGPLVMDPLYTESDDNRDVTYTITITGAQYEDNADYGCDSTLSPNNTAHLTVVVPSTSLYLYGGATPLDPDTDLNRLAPYTRDQLVGVTADARWYLMCVASGFVPKPMIELKFDGSLVESQTHHRQELVKNMSSGYVYSTHTVISTIRNQLPIKKGVSSVVSCSANVTDIRTVTHVRTVLRVKPLIECRDVAAAKYATNVSLVCTVTADPEVSKLRWEWIDRAGVKTVLLEGQSRDAVTARRDALNEGVLSVSLSVARVMPHHFHEYSLLAENAVGADMQTASIKQASYTAQAASTSASSKLQIAMLGMVLPLTILISCVL